MIDLHCHILPGIDDGAPDLPTALEMARIAVSDGIITVACTPHIMPGVYNNTGEGILAAVEVLAAALADAGIPLHLTSGADAHVAPDLITRLRNKDVPTIAGSRYFLFEPPHHILPPRLDEFAFAILAAGYVPILTHPERMSWIEGRYEFVRRLAAAGVLMQLTGGSLTGGFGRRARYWAERMLAEEIVHLIATDAHDAHHRPPRLAEARDEVSSRFNDQLAHRLVVTNPLCILENVLPSHLRRSADERAAKTNE